MMKPVVISLPICAVALSGCVMSQQGPFGPTETTVGPVPADATVSLDEATDTVTLRMGSEIRRIESAPTMDMHGFSGFYSGSNPYSAATSTAFVGETSSGTGQVTVVLDEFFDVTGTFLERTGDTEVPMSGTATYTGNYVALFSEVSEPRPGSTIDLDETVRVTGDAELEMNFADATVSGAITNRSSLNSIDVFDDITLEEGEIGNGAFSGVTSGGSLQTTGWTATAGDYEGLLIGPNGEEVVGGVSIRHEYDAADFVYLEIGGFVAE